jgi:phosphoglucomutase
MSNISILALALLVVCAPLAVSTFAPKRTNVAFHRRSSSSSISAQSQSTIAGTPIEVPTTPIEGMKPGTSGLRKKVEVWQGIDSKNSHYVENFIQSLLDTAAAKNERDNGKMPETMIVAGDGRYYNAEAMQIICRVLAANGVSNIWVPQGGIMSTPAVSASIRTREGGKADGGIILTASHNPGGPGEDFGIKNNLAFGQPAGEDFTDEVYRRSLEISSFKTLEGASDIDLNAAPGTTFDLTESSTVTIIDPFAEYIDTLKQCFDFENLRSFVQRPGFSMLFDGMHGAGGPFARKILVEELGLSEVSRKEERCLRSFFESNFTYIVASACRRPYCDVILGPTSANVTQIQI